MKKTKHTTKTGSVSGRMDVVHFPTQRPGNSGLKVSVDPDETWITTDMQCLVGQQPSIPKGACEPTLSLDCA